MGILALVLALHQIILNDFLKLSKATSLKEALGGSFGLLLHSGIGETGQCFTVMHLPKGFQKGG